MDCRPDGSAAAPLELRCSPHLLSWLDASQASLAVTTYQTHRLFLLGLKPDGTLSAFERLFEGAMGLHATDNGGLVLGTRFQIWRLDGTVPRADPYRAYDRLYVPRMSHTTGDLSIHDVAAGPDRQTWFTNTLYSCIAATSDRASFTPVWKPPFISKLVPEDRCHLNGLALRDSRPRYVSAVSRSDVAAGWRDRRLDSGCIIDIEANEIVATGLSMPHSPRFHQGRLWVLNSGTGELGYVDERSGRFEAITFCPGYLRGLAIHDGYAIVGLSKPRANRLFSGLTLDERLAAKDAEPRCGLWVVDLTTGHVAHWLEFHGLVTELYDVQVLPGVRRPAALGFRSDEIQRVIHFEDEGGPATHVLGGNHRPAARQSPPGPDPVHALPAHPGGYILRVHRALSLPGALTDLEPLTFPSLAKQARARDLHQPLLGVCAYHHGEPVGLAIAESHPEHEPARLLSLFVLPGHRGRGIGTALMSALEESVIQTGAVALDMAFRSDWPSVPALERLLEHQGWSRPEASMLLFKGTMDDIAAADWVRRCQPPPGCAIFAWQDLTGTERQAILAHQRAAPWYPDKLSPFQDEDRIEPLNSLGLRQGTEVVGWLITHRIAPDTIQYTTLFVRRDLQPLGRALPLLAEAIRRQMVSGVTKGTCVVDPGNPAMARYMARRFRPYGISVRELRRSHKALAGLLAANARLRIA